MIAAVAGAALYAIIVSIVLGAVLLAVVTLIVRTISLEARVRHALWTLALLATAIMPLGAFAVSAARASSAPAAGFSIRSPGSNAPDFAVSQTPDSGAGVSDAPADRRAGGAPFALPHPNRVTALSIAGIWLAGAIAGLAGLLRSVLRVGGLKRRSSPLDAERASELPWLTENGPHEREIYLRLSYETETPVAVGFGRPVILIPTDLATDGGLGAIESLVLHEHAHLRRYDDWTNLAQRLIERLFWFNPIVWVLGRKIALEREIAADDAVVETTGEPAAYAQSLWQLAREMRMPEHSVVAPGALFTRKQISVRIEALLERRPVDAGMRRVAALTVALTALGCTVGAAAGAPGITLPSVAVAEPAAVAERGPQPPAADASPAPAPALFVQSKPTAPTERAAPAVSPIPKIVAPTISPIPRSIDRSVEALKREVAVSVGGHISAALNDAARQSVASVTAALATAAEGTARVPSQPSHAMTDRQVSAGDGSDRVDLSGDLSGRDLSGRNLRGVDWRNRTLQGTNLSGADLRGAQLDGARLVGVDLSGARLDDGSFTNATLIGTTIDGVSLRGARTTGLRVSGTSLAGMDLRGLDIRAMLTACTGCDVSGADLRRADLHGLRLHSLNLSGADLRSADLHGTVVTASDLEAANLGNANLNGAAFVSCAMQGTNLNGAGTAGIRFEATDISI